MAMADTASLLKLETLPQLKDGLKDSDGAVRYWAAMGCLMRGAPAVDSARDSLRAALADSSRAVRVVAARALGQFGGGDDLALALPVLKDLAPPDRHGAYISILALNAIDALGSKAAPLLDTIRTMPTQEPSAPERANSYVSRLVKTITSAAGEKGP